MDKKLSFPKLGKLFEQARNRKEEWLWDKVIPANDLTLVAAFMKKGKTTLLTGIIHGLLKSGMYCGRGTGVGRRVLYLAPEEGDTLVKRFERLGFDEVDDVSLTVVPRGDPVWADLIAAYRMREWDSVIKWLKNEGYDTIVLDGLHTMLTMFEPGAKEDNESVGKFMAQFVLPFGSDFTVIASLHTKKLGGDARMKVPPEEMIRGASAWMAHPGQILVMEHDRKLDTKVFHAFGRYEGSSVNGWVIRYDPLKKDYVPWGEEEGTAAQETAAAIKADVQRALVQQRVLEMLDRSTEGLTGRELQDAIGGRRTLVVSILGELEISGEVAKFLTKSVRGGPPRQVYKRANPKNRIEEDLNDPDADPEVVVEP